MKRVPRTRLKIRQRAAAPDEAPGLRLSNDLLPGIDPDNDIPTGPSQQQPKKKQPPRETQETQPPQEKQYELPQEQRDSPPPEIALGRVFVVDTPEKRKLLMSARETDLQVVERLVVKGMYPQIFEERMQLKKKFFQNPGILYQDPGRDKDIRDIQSAFEYFWVYDMRLKMFSPGTTLEIEDCFIRPDKHMLDCSVDTLVVHYSDRMISQVQLPPLSLNPDRESVLEKIVVGMNAVLDCTQLEVDTLVCTNILSYGDTLSKAKEIRRLILLTELNPIRDADPERGDMVPEIPLANGMHTLWFPEAQEFRYDHYSLQKSGLRFVGIIPSVYYPSRMAVGIQKTWQPIHRESLEEGFVHLIDRTLL